MLPWGPPGTKFSTGTPKSHIGKNWNFAKLTHGPINWFHRAVSLCNIDSFNEHCNFLVANPDTLGAEMSQLLPEVSRFKIHHLGGILQLLMLCEFLRKSSSIFAFFGSWWHQNQFTHKIYFVCLLVYSYENEFQYSRCLPSNQNPRWKQLRTAFHTLEGFK